MKIATNSFMKNYTICFAVLAVMAVFPLVANAAATCGTTGMPGSITLNSIIFTPISNTVDNNGTNTLVITAQNTLNVPRVISYIQADCRCQQHLGYPYRTGQGQCQIYWDPNVNQIQECQQTPESAFIPALGTITLQTSVTQYQNQDRGSFQLDFGLQAVDGVAVTPTLMGFSFTDMCQDATVAAPVCSTNSQCGTNGVTGSPFCQGGNVYQNYTTYTCNNPGTANATCTNSTNAQLQTTCAGNQTCSNGTCSTVTCSTNSQCGTNGVTGNPFCQGGNVYQNYKTYTCLNPGTANSSCVNATVAQLQATCNGNQTCSNGICVTNVNPLIVSCNAQPNPASTNQSVNFIGTATGGTGNYTYQWSDSCSAFSQNCTHTFYGAGTYTALLTVTSGNQTQSTSCDVTVNQSCTPNATQKCVGGSAYNFDSCGNQGSLIENCTAAGKTCSNGTCLAVTCSTNSQCGTNSVIGNPFCQGGNVYQNYTTYTCNNPGTANSTCTNTVTPQLKTTCNGNQTCSNGTCNTVNIACSTNSDCGTNILTGNPFCNGNSIYQNYKTYTCNNPGTANSSCSDSTSPQLQNTCSGNQTCSNGTCLTNVPNLVVSCVASPNPANTNQLVNFTATATGGTGSYAYQWAGSCNGYSQNCSNTFANSGTNTAFLIVTSGSQTQNASCSVVVNQSCTPNATQKCVGGSAYNFDSCGNQGSLIENCSADGKVCSNGSCVPVRCSTNSDCGTNTLSGNPFCQGGNVYQNYKTYTCNSPGTANSSCSDSTAPQLQTTCNGNQTCSNGTCNTVNIACSTNSDCGTNILTGNPFCQGGNVYQNYKTYTCNNPGTANSNCSNSTAAQLQTTCSGSQTCSNGTCNTVNIACSTNSQCGNSGVTGSPFCQGGNVYQNYTTYTCQNPGTANSVCSNSTSAQLQTTCSGNQTCNNGSCSTVACSTNSQCGVSGVTGSPFCQGNGVYQNYTTYTCQNPGTSSSVCSNSTIAQLQTTCSYGQTCQGNGTCTTTNTCTPNYSERCLGNSVYWFDSCGNQGGIAQQCSYNQTCSGTTCIGTTNTCTPNYSERCLGNSVYWYDSCGNVGGIAQTCGYNQTCSGSTCIGTTQNQETLTIVKTVRDLSTGNLNWANSVNANPGDIIEFQILVSSPTNQYVNSVTVRDILSNNLTYDDSLTLDGVSVSGNIISGLNIGSISVGQTRTITYQAQVASGQNY